MKSPRPSKSFTRVLKTCVGLFAALAMPVLEGFSGANGVSGSALEMARRPVSNIVFFDLPVTSTALRPIYIYQNLSDRVSIGNGNTVPMGGELQLVAVQAEVAVTERLSLVASKDGYLWFNPENTFTDSEGFADLALGPKYTFWLDAEEGIAAAGKVIIEVPTGADRVWQGNGDGTATPTLSLMKVWQDLQLLASAGLTAPFDTDEESVTAHQSYHVSYGFFENLFSPLIEIGHWYVIDDADGHSNFPPQAGGAVPSLVDFEGGDLVNFGSSASAGSHSVTLLAGVRSRIHTNVELGFGYEIPLSEKEKTLIEERITLDVAIDF